MVIFIPIFGPEGLGYRVSAAERHTILHRLRSGERRAFAISWGMRQLILPLAIGPRARLLIMPRLKLSPDPGQSFLYRSLNTGFSACLAVAAGFDAQIAA
ncbi:MAG: hypothetical protein PHX82_05195 [Paracoccaceae bacterium]|nr:hypothetical protein [Paracoccaceae bacterium]